MAAPVLQFKRGAFANLPGLRAGEPGFTTDKYDLYVGLTSETSTNKFFGSHRYWTRENGTISLRLNLVDKDGTNSISIKAPNTLSGVGTYILPDTSTITDGYFLKVATDGTLSWGAVGGTNGTFTNPTLTGLTTITGSLDATGANVNAGIVTVTDLYIDTTRVLYDDGSGVTLAGIQTIDATTKQTLEEILALEPNNFNSLNVTGIATVGGLIDANGGLDVTGQTTLNNNLSVTGVSTFTGNLTANGNVTLGDTSGDAITIKGTTTFEQIITGTATTSNTIAVTDTDAVTAGLLFASSGTGSTVYNDTDLTYNSATNILSVPILSATTEVRTGAVKAADGTAALTIANTTGAVTAGNDLTVQGNLYVNGSTTQVNTNTLTVEDRTLELGTIQVGQPTTTTWDLAVLFNYGDGVAKKAGVIWEASGATKRFQFTTNVNTGADGGPADTNLPSFTVSNFAPIEISELWVNNSCTGGAQQVIGCVGAELQLQNIVVDAGTF